MNLVIDVLHADVIEFSCERTALSSGATHSSIEENIKAVFESIGIELIEYDTAVRHPIDAIRIGYDANGSPVEEVHQRINFRLMSKAWLRKLHG